MQKLTTDFFAQKVQSSKLGKQTAKDYTTAKPALEALQFQKGLNLFFCKSREKKLANQV